MISKLFIGILFSCSILSGCTEGVNSKPARAIFDKNTNPASPAASLSPSGKEGIKPYLGCWTGMHGGKLRLTSSTISDLGSGEQSEYIEIDQKEVDGKTVYVLEAQNDFPKSFLSKVIYMSFDMESYKPEILVGIATYENKQDLAEDRLFGQGLFENIDCAKLEK